MPRALAGVFGFNHFASLRSALPKCLSLARSALSSQANLSAFELTPRSLCRLSKMRSRRGAGTFFLEHVKNKKPTRTSLTPGRGTSPPSAPKNGAPAPVKPPFSKNVLWPSQNHHFSLRSTLLRMREANLGDVSRAGPRMQKGALNQWSRVPKSLQREQDGPRRQKDPCKDVFEAMLL